MGFVLSRFWVGFILVVVGFLVIPVAAFAEDSQSILLSDEMRAAFEAQGLDYQDFLETYQRGLMTMPNGGEAGVGAGDNNVETVDAGGAIEFLPDNPVRDEASPLYEAIILFDEENYSEAFPVLLREALDGDAEAAYLVARSFEHGYYVEEDFDTAIEWYLKSAELLYRPAMVALARLHLTSDDVSEEDVESALNLLQNLTGYAAAEYWLGIIYHPERGWKNDADLSFAWFMAAATKGHRRALYEVSEAFCFGYGVDVSAEQSYIWRVLAYDIMAYDVRAWQGVSCGDEALSIDDIITAIGDAEELADVMPLYEGWE